MSKLENDEQLLASAERLLAEIEQEQATKKAPAAQTTAIEQGPLESLWFADFLEKLADRSQDEQSSIVGRRIGTIEILCVVGEGGMGIVFEGWDSRLERRVALKRLNDFGPVGKSSKERLLREARALSRLDHPGICRVLDLVEHEGVDLLVLEFIEGRTLRELIDEGLDQQSRLQIAIEVADAMSEAHASGVVHRDLKPENIHVQPDGKAKILDFGIARLAQQEPSPNAESQEGGDDHPERAEARPYVFNKTLSRSLHFGTPRYMSPEQALGEAIGPPTDAWSFGIVLQELFDLKNPASPLQKELSSLADELTREKPEQRCEAAEAKSRLVAIVERPIKRRRTGRIVLATALALILGTASTASLLSYRTALEKRWSERWEEEVTWVSNLRRHAFTQPEHDVRSELAQITQRALAVDARVEAAPNIAQRTGAAALGRIHIELGEFDQARLQLEKSVAAGVRDSVTLRALGETLGRLYVIELEKAESITSESLRQLRIAAAELELHDPAVHYLTSASQAETEDASLTLARLAWLNGRLDDALELSAAAIGQNPWLYQAHVLAGEILHARAAEQLRNKDPELATVDLDAAAQQYELALEVGRSDPNVYERACYLASHRLAMLESGLLGTFDSLYEDAIHRCERVTQINSDRGDHWARLAHIRLRKAQRTFYSGGDASSDIQLARAAASKAIERQPTGYAHVQRGWAYLLSVLADRAAGRDATAHLIAMTSDFDLVTTLEPTMSSGFSSGIYGASVVAEYLRDFGGDPTTTVEATTNDYLATLELDPNDTMVHLNTGWCWVILAQHQLRVGLDPTTATETALNYFGNDEQQRDSNPDLHGNIGETHLVLAEYQTKRGQSPGLALEAARTATRTAIKLNDQVYWTHLDLAYADLIEAEWLLSGRSGSESDTETITPWLESAERHTQSALKIFQGYSIAHKVLGQIDVLHALARLRAGRGNAPNIGEARDHFDRALELDSTLR